MIQFPSMQKSNAPVGGFVGAYLKQVRDELRQVTWPTKQETIRFTTIVVLTSLIVGVYLGGLDYLLTRIMGLVLR